MDNTYFFQQHKISSIWQGKMLIKKICWRRTIFERISQNIVWKIGNFNRWICKYFVIVLAEVNLSHSWRNICIGINVICTYIIVLISKISEGIDKQFPFNYYTYATHPVIINGKSAFASLSSTCLLSKMKNWENNQLFRK